MNFPYRREKKMKLKMCIAITAATILTGQTVIHAEEAEKPTAGVDLGVFSQYIWRGEALSKNSLVIQPSVTLGYKGVSLNVWGNLDTDSKPWNGAKYNETDITLSYAKTIGITKLTGGYIYYALDETPTARDTQEIFGSVGLNVLLSPTLTVYRDISAFPGWYINLGVSHSIEIVDKITFDLAGSAGYYYSDSNSLVEAKNPNSKYRALHNGLLSAGFTIPFGEYFSVKPMIAYSFALSNKADDFIKLNSVDGSITNGVVSGDSSYFYGGVTLSMAF
jgi:hypothetical protein